MRWSDREAALRSDRSRDQPRGIDTDCGTRSHSRSRDRQSGLVAKWYGNGLQTRSDPNHKTPEKHANHWKF
jgi:hypothetical protein